MPNHQSENTQAIIDKYTALLMQLGESNIPPVTNRQTLLEKSIILELSNELYVLSQLLNDNTREVNQLNLAALCSLRQEKNNGTCLSFSAMPRGDCNEMYWALARVILEPTSLRDILVVLMPDLNRELVWGDADELLPELDELGRKRKMKDRVVSDVSERELTNNFFKGIEFDKSTILENFLICGRYIIDLTQIQEFDFETHVKLYNKLCCSKYANIKKALYTRNEDLRTLEAHILQIKRDGTTLYDELCKLISILKMSGERISGAQLARQEAVNASTQFWEFLMRLPVEPVDMRSAALGLSYHSHTLKSVLKDLLDYGRCVEEAAGWLKEILTKHRDTAIMHQRPLLSKKRIDDIISTYSKPGSKRSIKIVGDNNVAELPLHLTIPLLREVTIGSTEDYFEFFRVLDEGDYASFFEHLTVTCSPPLPGDLHIALGALKASQVLAFFECIARFPAKFGGIHSILFLARQTFNAEAIYAVISKMPDDSTRFFQIDVSSNANGGSTALHFAASSENPAILVNFLKLLSQSQLSHAVNRRDASGESVLQILVRKKYLNILLDVLRLMPASARLVAVQLKDSNGETGLDLATQFEGGARLIDVIKLIPETCRLEALIAKDAEGQTVLHRVAHTQTPKRIQGLLDLLPALCRLMAAKVRNSKGKSVMHDAALNETSAKLVTILTTVPESGQIEALEAKDSIGDTVLHRAARNKNSSMLLDVLRVIPESFKFDMVMERGYCGESVLDIVVQYHNRAMLLEVIALISASSRLETMKKMNDNGDTPLNMAAKNKILDVLQACLAMIPEADRLDMVRSKNSSGNTMLHLAASNPNPAVLQTLLGLIPRSDQIKAVMEKNNKGETVLDIAMQNPNPSLWQAIILIVPEDRRIACNELINYILHNKIKPEFTSIASRLFGVSSTSKVSLARAMLGRLIEHGEVIFSEAEAKTYKSVLDSKCALGRLNARLKPQRSECVAGLVR